MPDHDPFDHSDDDGLDDDLDDDDDLDNDLDLDPDLGPVDPGDLPEDVHPEMILLDRIPRRLWEQTLAPLHRSTRVWVARQVSDERLREFAMELTLELDLADSERRRVRDEARFNARRTGYPLPTPHPVHAATGPTVQVNMRLRRDDHERLAQAAAAVGMKPTTLARALLLNGAGAILREHAAAEGPRSVRSRTPGYP